MLRKTVVLLAALAMILVTASVPLLAQPVGVQPNVGPPQNIDPDYARKIALEEQYGPFCELPIDVNTTPPACAYPGPGGSGALPGDPGVGKTEAGVVQYDSR